MRTRSTLLAATLAVGLGFPTAGYSIYFWRDAAGRPNYTDVCPAGVTCVPMGPGGRPKA